MGDAMKIVLRIIHHPTNYKGECMGIFKYTQPVEADGVSATANSCLGSPLNSIISVLNYDREMVGRASKRTNRAQKIATLNCLSPKLFLVPKTDGGCNVNVERIADELMDAVSVTRVQNLNFTHYGFVKEKLPVQEIMEVLKSMSKVRIESSLKTVIWDIDRRHIEEMKRIEKFIS